MTTVLNHLAVIMARGESQRMGQPKGLCRLHPEDECFLIKVVRLYNQFGIPILLVVRPEDEADYLEVLSGEKVDVLVARGGGETALTMKLAVDLARDQGLNPKVFWAHPVDMPQILPQTLEELMEAAAKGSLKAWRPLHDNNPGHPVLIPASLLSKVLSAESLNVSMSRAWKNASAKDSVPSIKMLMVADSGVITDFDTPDQLHAAPEKKAPES